MGDTLQADIMDTNSKSNLKLRAVIAYGVRYFFAAKDQVTGVMRWFKMAPGQLLVEGTEALLPIVCTAFEA